MLRSFALHDIAVNDIAANTGPNTSSQASGLSTGTSRSSVGAA